MLFVVLGYPKSTAIAEGKILKIISAKNGTQYIAKYDL